MTLLRSHTLTVSIALPCQQVYEFASNPENLPRWAVGLGKSVRRQGDAWLVEATQGWVSVRFAPPNEYGVLDHVVTISPENVVTVPMRVIANGSGAEVLFTLFQSPEMTDEQFTTDRELVASDLAKLKQILEVPNAT